MDGAQDLGGKQGFGPVVRDPNEPLFHADWERTVFGMMLTTLAQGVYNLDEIRHGIERMEPVHYLSSTYYEHWLAGLERVLIEKGVARADEIEARVAAVRSNDPSADVPRRENPELTAGLGAGIATGFPVTRKSRKKPKFAVGDAVVVRRMFRDGHTRCPAYVRGARGKIIMLHGHHVFPDVSAHGHEGAEPLYNVAFDASELWSDKSNGAAHVDLWESYLLPVAVKAKKVVKTKKVVKAKRTPAKRKSVRPAAKKARPAKATKGKTKKRGARR